MIRIQAERHTGGWAVLGLAGLLAACQMAFLPPKRDSVVPERAELLGLEGPVEVAIHTPVWCQKGVIRASGSATNFTGKPLAQCTVHFRFEDDNGTTVATALAYNLGGLEKGEKWSFEVTATGAPIADKFYNAMIGRVTVMPR